MQGMPDLCAELPGKALVLVRQLRGKALRKVRLLLCQGARQGAELPKVFGKVRLLLCQLWPTRSHRSLVPGHLT